MYQNYVQCYTFCSKQLTENYTDAIYCGILHAPTKLILLPIIIQMKH